MKSTQHSEITIIGGGLVGLTAALALAHHQIPVTVIEHHDLSLLPQKKSDKRVSAIALGSKEFLENIGAWATVEPKAGAIRDIRVTDYQSSLFLHFDRTMAGNIPMGYMVENHDMHLGLWQLAAKHPLITLLTPCKIDSMEQHAQSVTLTTSQGVIETSLLIAADGRASWVRENLSIPTTVLDYHQTGIVCIVKHERDHQGVAVEHFTPSGPFAILPMQGGYHSAIVWTEKTHLAPLFMAMSESEFMAHLTERFGDFLGELSLAGGMGAYPLQLVYAHHAVKGRTILVGDAAHGIHPIAGQGFNLGIRDIETLSELLSEQAGLGLDKGSAALLARYEKARCFDVTSMVAATDLLNRLFSNKIVPLKLARDIGLAAVNKLPSLKKYFMMQAMGK